MVQIININTSVIGTNKVNSVNARELHKALDIKKDFSDWIKSQIESLGLIENTDYIVISAKNVNSLLPQKVEQKGRGGHNAKEYILTLEMAKHIAMASRGNKGREVRDYFVKVEEQYKVGIEQYKALEQEKQEIEKKYYAQLETTNKLLLEKLDKSEKAKEHLQMRRGWGKEELVELERLYNMGYKPYEIAKKLNRSKDSIATKIRTYIKGKK